MKRFKEFLTEVTENDSHVIDAYHSTHRALSRLTDQPMWFSLHKSHARGWHANTIDNRGEAYTYSMKVHGNIARHQDDNVQRILKNAGVDPSEYAANLVSNPTKDEVNNDPGTIALKKHGYHGYIHPDYDPTSNFTKDADSMIVFNPEKHVKLGGTILSSPRGRKIDDSAEKQPGTFEHHLANDSTVSHDEIENVLAERHPNHIRALAKNQHPHIINDVLDHRNIGSKITHLAVLHPDPQIAMKALKHLDADSGTVNAAVRHPDTNVALAAMKHHLADYSTIWSASWSENPHVVMAALSADKTNKGGTPCFAVRHPDPNVALAGLNHHAADSIATKIAAQHPSPIVAMAALRHKKADRETIETALNHPDPQVQAAARAKLNE